jgi:hypothetical protein
MEGNEHKLKEISAEYCKIWKGILDKFFLH